MGEELKLALPLVGERVSPHFGHPECFAMVRVDRDSGQILEQQLVDPPPHQPGLLPAWLVKQGVGVILAGGIGARAVTLLRGQGVEVVSGVPALAVPDAVALWLQGKLELDPNMCDHSGHGAGHAHGRCGDKGQGHGGCRH